MGYYCDVLVVMTEDTHTKFLEEIEKIKEQNNKLYLFIKDIINNSTKKIKNTDYLYQFNSIKWKTIDIDSMLKNCDLFKNKTNTEEFIDPTYTLHHILLSLNEEQYLYLIIGEEFSDIETYGRYWSNNFNVSIVRDFYYED